MTSRQRSLPEIVDALIAAGLVDAGRRAAALDVLAADEAAVEPGAGAPASGPVPQHRWWVEVAGYVGGAMVLASVAVLLAQTWSDLSFGAQSGLLVVVSLTLAVAAGMVRGRDAEDRADPVRRRLAATLGTAAVLAASGLSALVVDRVLHDYTAWPGAVAGVVLTVGGLLAYRHAPSVIGQGVVLWGVIQTAVLVLEDLARDAFDVVPANLDVAALLLLTGLAWWWLASRGTWREDVVARVIGAMLLGLGSQWPVIDGEHREWGYALSVAVAVAALVVYQRHGHWSRSALGITLLALTVPEALIDWTDGALGGAGILLVCGLALLGAATAGLGLRRRSEEPAG
ncbi:hypothetical protein [Nocardioides sp. R-C-SC26]|uniref:hypothetical protein n=1 Tax=Nocardioides sp. R-C-SC26 TaxID=2870414 RepID=UPI001E447356|nr:hypothetical protein [Nocardioides sp. R-C-SC26]